MFKKKPPQEIKQEDLKMETVLNERLSSLEKMLGVTLKWINATNVFKSVMMLFGMAMMIIYGLFDTNNFKASGEIAVIQIQGEINESNSLGNGAMISRAIDDAMNNQKTKAILIKANSGGGSPVQGEIINEAIKEIKSNRDNDIKIIVSIADMCASACYMAIQNADEIYAHKTSLVGSIGVRMDGIEIDKALSNFDIERRVITSGKYKALLDPYSNLTQEQEQFISDTLITPLYNEFVADVKEARGDKLADNENLFSGLVWTGNQSKELGLIDNVKTIYHIEKSLEGDDIEFHYYNKKPFSFKNMLTAAISDAIKSAVTDNPIKS